MFLIQIIFKQPVSENCILCSAKFLWLFDVPTHYIKSKKITLHIFLVDRP